MLFTTSSLSRSHPPTLPSELIDRILQDQQLSKSDLARCCLVSHQFLPTAQHCLYSSIHIVWIRFMTFCNEPNSFFKEEWLYTNRSYSLIRTLECNAALRRKVKKLSMWKDQTRNPKREDYECLVSVTLGEVIESNLAQLPQVNSLAFDIHSWGEREVREVVFRQGGRWEEIDIWGGQLLDQVPDSRPWSALPNLKRLRCGTPALSDYIDRPIPSSLEIFDLPVDVPCTYSIKPAPNSQLRVLRLPATNDKLRHIDHFHRLEHLSLYEKQHAPSLSPSTLIALSTLPLLRSLTLVPSPRAPSSQDPHLRSLTLASSARDSSWSTTLSAILKHLPPSISRLDITRHVSWSQLYHLFRTELPPYLRVLGLPRYSASSASREVGRTLLLVLCHERGIRVEDIEEEPDLFDL